jgi:ATP-dependent helicase/nuclease subunit A
VVLLPNEIWLVDFKTDEIVSDEVEAKTKLYEPQLKLYALALERIYRRPVTECRLHFLALPQAGRTAPSTKKHEQGRLF